VSVSLEFFGAAGEVTGSRTLMRYDHRTTLVDCGLFQGPKHSREKNWARFAVAPADINSVVLTHAHLDHSGWLPRLWKQGFRGPVHCSEGTADIARLLLLDAAHLEEEQADFANRTGYSHHVPALPLFDTNDAEEAIKLFVPHPRETWVQLDDSVSFRFLRAGHIIGASLIQFNVAFDNSSLQVTFSGDLGHSRSVTMRAPVDLLETDILVLESTYGNRLHPREDAVTQVGEIAKRTFARGGVLVVPSFAVGRAQEIIYLIRLLEDRGIIKPVPVILDSPLSSAATAVFRRHDEDHHLGSVFAGGGAESFLPRRFEVSSTPDESMLACMRDGPMVVISASGMLTGGRILHHLKARLPDERNTVLFTGYQAEGTKGRVLLDAVGGLKTLRIHHKEVPIAADIVAIETLSGHGDSDDLLAWIKRIKRKPRHIILNHGSEDAMTAFAAKIAAELPGIKVTPVLQPQKIDLCK